MEGSPRDGDVLSGARAARPLSKVEAEAFRDRWVATLPERLAWLREELVAARQTIPNGSLASLDGLLPFVVARIGLTRPVDAPEWYDERVQSWGWSEYGAALAEGLMAYVVAIYRAEAGDAADWVVDHDPRNAFFRHPVPRDPAIAPAWRQVISAISKFRAGAGADCLRISVQSSLQGYRDARAGVGGDGGQESVRLPVAAPSHAWLAAARRPPSSAEGSVPSPRR
jgi:hypothetical protein